MKKILEHIKKYRKDWMIVIAVVAVGFFAVMGWHFTDVAKKPFWWKFWPVLAVLCIVAWVAGWVFLKSKEKNK